MDSNIPEIVKALAELKAHKVWTINIKKELLVNFGRFISGLLSGGVLFILLKIFG